MSDERISFIIPNWNGGATIKKCLEATFAVDDDNFEVIVVDDGSDDNSVEIIKSFPCKLIQLEKRSGASKARNVGAFSSDSKYLFFTDADCVPQKDILKVTRKTIAEQEPGMIIGGTYTREPYDKRFFSRFQSVFINHFETKTLVNPDYIASHALVMETEIFRKSGGFSNIFMPTAMIEDVEFSHNLRKSGYKLMTNPDILVEHCFNFCFYKSMRNGWRKAVHWTRYSMTNKDLLSDSGAASIELKFNLFSYGMIVAALFFYALFKQPAILSFAPLFLAMNIFVNRGLIRAFYETGGVVFCLLTTTYYTLIYPLPIVLGSAVGVMKGKLR